MDHPHPKCFRLEGLPLLLICLFLCSCNATIEKVANKSVPINKKYEAAIQYPLVPILDVESINRLKIKDIELGAYHHDLVSRYALDIFESDLRNNLFVKGNNYDYNGYIKCSLVSDRAKTKAWGIIPSVLTLFMYNCLGGPIAHLTLERTYRFDIYDAFGNNVKTYTLKGVGKSKGSLYASPNFDGTELTAFRDALKKFEEEAGKDANFINSRLGEAAYAIKVKRNRQIGERDMILADWLNSGEMPSEQELNDAVANASDDYVGWGLRAVRNASQGQFTASLNDINEYCKLNPACEIIRPYYYKAVLLYQLNRKSDAFEALCVEDKLHPNNESVALLKGTILYECGAYSAALSSFEDASRINPDNTEIYQTISQTRDICRQLAENRKQAEIDQSMRRAQAMQLMSNAMSNTAASIASLNAHTHGQNGSYGNVVTNTNQSSSGASPSRTKKRTCSMCHGRGWIAGTSGVSFDSSTSYYCKECGREVPSSHTHDTCPSCRGEKEIITIR